MSAALYVYGIAAAGRAPDPAALAPGLGGAAVEEVAAAGFLALVSPWAEAEPPEATRRHMLAHTAVLERAVARADVLPVRFGTVAPDPAHLRRCLEEQAPALAAALEGVAGRIELGVKVSWAEGVAFREILERDDALRALRDRLRARPAAQTYQERIELGRRVGAALAGKREEEAGRILAALAPLADRSVDLPLGEETMVLNRAFLVRREAEPRFDEAMRRLGEEAGVRLGFRYVGPVPPYNFVSLRAAWLGPGS